MIVIKPPFDGMTAGPGADRPPDQSTRANEAMLLAKRRQLQRLRDVQSLEGEYPVEGEAEDASDEARTEIVLEGKNAVEEVRLADRRLAPRVVLWGRMTMPKTINPQTTDHRLYRLEPIATTLERDEWTASTVRETLWVRASSEAEARAMVEIETRRNSGTAIEPPFFSPWSSSFFSTCEIHDAAPFVGYPLGMVMTASGPLRDASAKSNE
jgi:hypothetical protein